jgi:nitrate reductase NapE component
VPDPAVPESRADVETIEGGDVQQVADLQIEERRHRAATARVLAYSLLGLLAATIATQYGFTLWLILSGKNSDVAALDKLFNALLPILSGLVGGAVTYYFTKERS